MRRAASQRWRADKGEARGAPGEEGSDLSKERERVARAAFEVCWKMDASVHRHARRIHKRETLQHHALEDEINRTPNVPILLRTLGARGPVLCDGSDREGEVPDVARG